MANPAEVDVLYKRIGRFLHTGLEVPKYYPGCWNVHKYFEQEKLPAIEELFLKDANHTAVVEIIVKAYKDQMYTRYDSIAFALAKCIAKGSDLVKEAAYKAVSEVCASPEQLMLFTKFTKLFGTGNGHGWRKAVSSWYLSKDPMQLAKECSRVKGRHGRSHETLIRMTHLKVNESDIARNAVVKYVLFGLKDCKQNFGSKSEAKEVIEYLEKIEGLRHCEDPAAAAAIISQNKFTLDHVPAHLLTANEVWDAILPQFSIEEILNNLQRIHNMGFLGSNSKTTGVIVSLLSNKDLIKKSKVTPLHVHITLSNYEKNTKPMKFEKVKFNKEKEARRRTRQSFDKNTGQWEWNVGRRHPKEIKHWGIDQLPNPAIIKALHSLLGQSWALTPATQVRYMITLDMRHHMFKGRQFSKTPVTTAVAAPAKKSKKNNALAATPAAPPPTLTPSGDAPATTNSAEKSKKHLRAECFYQTSVSPGLVGIILALQLSKREKDVKVAVFTDDGVEIVQLGNQRNFTTIAEAEFMFRNANAGKVNMDAPIEWAKKNRRPVDVFINVVDRVSRIAELDEKGRAGRGQGGKFGPPPSKTSNHVDRCPVRALERYRQENKMPKAKLITLSLASHKIEITDGSHEGVLDVVGVDVDMPKVLDAFAKGQFL